MEGSRDMAPSVGGQHIFAIRAKKASLREQAGRRSALKGVQDAIHRASVLKVNRVLGERLEPGASGERG